MPAETITCPSCQATLRPKAPAAPGARIKCPKCTAVFAVPDGEDAAPEPTPRPVKPKRAAKREEPEEDLEGGEILDDEPQEDELDEEEMEEDRPIKRKKKKALKKKGVPLWIWLVGGGLGLMFLLCLGCGGVFYYIGSNVVNAGSGNVTFFNYLKIQKGASEADVKAILGEPEKGFAQMMDDPHMKTRFWRDGQNVIMVNFVDDKARNRSCNLVGKSGVKVEQSGFPGQ